MGNKSTWIVQPLSLNNIYINRLASLTCSFYFSRQFFFNVKDTLHIIHFRAKYSFGYLNYSANNGISFQGYRRVIALFISMWWPRVQSKLIEWILNQFQWWRRDSLKWEGQEKKEMYHVLSIVLNFKFYNSIC